MADESSRPKDDGLSGDDAEAIERRLEAFEARLREIGDPSMLSSSELDEAEDLLRKLGYTDTGANAVETAANVLQARIDQLEHKAEDLGVRPDTSAIDAEFDAKLKSLEERASGALAKRQNEKQAEAARVRSDADSTKGLGIGLSIAYTLFAFPLVGFFFGWLIDRGTDSNLFSALLTAGGAVLGVIYVVIVVQRHNK